jgi:hypothetical protein
MRVIHPSAEQIEYASVSDRVSNTVTMITAQALTSKPYCLQFWWAGMEGIALKAHRVQEAVHRLAQTQVDSDVLPASWALAPTCPYEKSKSHPGLGRRDQAGLST